MSGARGDGVHRAVNGPAIPFAFAVYPRSLDRALRERRLAQDDYVILVALYARANRSTWVTSATLEQLAEWIAWDRSHDWLRKRLVALRSCGWIAYQSKPGLKHHGYAIRLLYASEQSLSTETAESLSTSGGESRSTPDVPRVAGPNVSEHDPGADPPTSLSTSLASLSTEEAANPLAERDRIPPTGDASLSTRDVRERAKALSKGRLKDKRLGSANEDHSVGKGPRAPAQANAEHPLTTARRQEAKLEHERQQREREPAADTIERARAAQLFESASDVHRKRETGQA